MDKVYTYLVFIKAILTNIFLLIGIIAVVRIAFEKEKREDNDD